jgi:DNA-binding NarL/FixJ family response regulator
MNSEEQRASEQGFAECGPGEIDRRGTNGGLKRETPTLVLIDSRALGRGCLARHLRERGSFHVLEFGTVADWRQQGRTASVVLLNIGGGKATDEEVTALIAGAVRESSPAPVVVLADSDELALILEALQAGAKGYIPSSNGLDICVEALNLALAGGIFIPANSILGLRTIIDATAPTPALASDTFTPREKEVIQALRVGKANKVIAAELKMQASTVKIHVHNIMRKLKASNRTEVVYKLSQMYAKGKAIKQFRLS